MRRWAEFAEKIAIAVVLLGGMYLVCLVGSILG